MSKSKEELRAEILQIIKDIGQKEHGFVKFNISSLSANWGAKHKEKFASLGCGKFAKFVVDECNAEKIDGDKYRVKFGTNKAGNVGLVVEETPTKASERKVGENRPMPEEQTDHNCRLTGR